MKGRVNKTNGRKEGGKKLFGAGNKNGVDEWPGRNRGK